MVDLNAVNSILSIRNGVWTLVVLALITIWRGYPHIPAIITAWSERRRAIQAAKDADWTRLREEVSRHAERIDTLETKVRECEEREAAWMHRAIRAEATLLGQGEVRQAAAAAAAEVRADPSKAPTTRERFEGSGGK